MSVRHGRLLRCLFIYWAVQVWLGYFTTFRSSILKKVLLTGVLFFGICCLLILLTQDMAQFLILRFLQGIGLTVIAAVGYAAIQETFAERDAIKVMALMVIFPYLHHYLKLF